ncbi:Na+/Pi-cotransporter [Polystyrenella longa]|uniref:Na+/Pi-cotransporter n=1 Tax=Polystyrenella longa TaxID=2528007 RepID=A0A518CU12_9PLAN|nr:Na/Pi cotransporter family protein [Polystyrenella longa]QDU82701.1 Na+/Pi-cotransporter [Polystyrenella longa]
MNITSFLVFFFVAISQIGESAVPLIAAETSFVEVAVESNSLMLAQAEAEVPALNVVEVDDDEINGEIPDPAPAKEEKKKKPDEFPLTSLIFTLVGGLGIFLYGMKNMSEGMQAVAGNSLRNLINKVTNNRIVAASVGTLVTMIVQSSSVTTVMVVGFVNSGLMNLTQAIGVIMGANIGTTVTGWILALKIGKYGLPILGFAVFAYLFSNKDRTRYIAMSLMGMGMVFFGLELMKDACGTIEDTPQFQAWFDRFTADDFGGMVMCMLVGCITTMVVQSSSATLGITIALAVEGSIGYETAAALVLGENVGTTITALMASLNATTNARRAAYFHAIFNLAGVCWIALIFRQYVQFIPWLVDVDLTSETGMTSAIATTHSVFNIVNTLIFLPFVPMFANLLMKLIPDSTIKETPHLTSLDIRMLETPTIAIEQSRHEIIHMGEGCQKMMTWLRELLQQKELDKDLVQKFYHREEVLDKIQDEITAFMTDLLAGNVPHEVINEGRMQLRMADELESVSDYIRSILKFHQKLIKQGHGFDEQHLNKLLKLHDEVQSYVDFVIESYKQGQYDILSKSQIQSRLLKQNLKTLRKQHMEYLTEEKVEPFMNVAYMSTLNSYTRVRDHIINVTEAMAGEK